MAVTQITNHVEQAKARFTEQFKDKTKLLQFLEAMLADTQDLETAMYALLTLRQVDTAEGVQLDVLGRIVGQPRLGLSDDDYRPFIKTRIAVNQSDGLVSQLINIVQLALSGQIADLDTLTVKVEQQPPAAIEVIVQGTTLTEAFSDFLLGFLLDAKAAAARLILRFLLSEDAESFSTAIFTALNGGHGASATTLIVDSTADFPTSGSLILDQGLPVEETVTYIAKTATQFTGVSATSNVHSDNAAVQLATGPGLGFDDEGAPGSGGKFASAKE